MNSSDEGTITLYDLEAPVEDFRAEVLAGLTQSPKSLPPKFFYDDEGARLFEQICELPEYYPTRTEMGILRRHGAEIADLIGPDCLLVEFGSGATTKVRILLDNLEAPAAYVPVEISKAQLIETSAALAQSYPSLEVLPVCADYMNHLTLPAPQRPPARTVAFFPGSTIGNLEPDDANRFLTRVTHLCGPGGGLVIGVDLKKDPALLEPAYNDAQGVTADFNLNVLRHINRELGADFNLRAFRHFAFYDQKHGRIEMRLISLRPQVVDVAGEQIVFDEGEPITTEYSYKYSLEDFRRAAANAGFVVEKVWTDDRQLFSVQYLVVSDRLGDS